MTEKSIFKASTALNAMTAIELYLNNSTRFTDHPLTELADAIDSLGTKEAEFAENVQKLGIQGPCTNAFTAFRGEALSGVAQVFTEMRRLSNRLRKVDAETRPGIKSMRRQCELLFDHLMAHERSVGTPEDEIPRRVANG